MPADAPNQDQAIRAPEAVGENVPVRFALDQLTERVIIPHGSRVFLEVDGESGPERHEMQPGGRRTEFEITHDVPIGRVNYRFVVEPPQGVGLLFQIPADGSTRQQEVTAESAGNPSPRASASVQSSLRGTPRDGGATEDDDLLDEDSDVVPDDLQEVTRDMVHEVLERSGGMVERPTKQSLREYAAGLRRFAEHGREAVRSSGNRRVAVRALRAEVEAGVSRHILNSPELSLDATQRRLLESAPNRLQFRILAFNNLCTAGLFGLQVADRITSRRGITQEKLSEHITKKLGTKYAPFVLNIFSRFDAGNVHDDMHALVAEIGKKYERPSDGETQRHAALKNLDAVIYKRIGANFVAHAPQLEASSKFSKFLSGVGGVAVDVGLFALLFSHPALAAGLWVGRATTRGLGYKFGQVCKKAVGFLPGLLKSGVTSKIRNLSPEVREKLDPEIREWVQTAGIKPQEALERGNASWGRFWRNMLPFPGALARINKLKAIVPHEHGDISAEIHEKYHGAEEKVEKACTAALSRLRSVATSRTATRASHLRRTGSVAA